ncbi:hypothetical protein AUK10_02225 [Candidatus Gracilibacteria bacterium CG2_30_37_12]|nr:MAG: hypothetical protein AUK10_02225 [Candidatus Gracilibacteria bacterium CG2_30_37_12]
MKQYKPKDIIAFLKRMGWIEDHITGSHVIMYQSTSKKRTTVPLHKKDIPVGTLMAILKQTGLTKEDLEK